MLYGEAEDQQLCLLTRKDLIPRLKNICEIWQCIYEFMNIYIYIYVKRTSADAEWRCVRNIEWWARRRVVGRRETL